MLELEKKFRSNPENEEVFQNLLHQYKTEAKWEKLVEIYIYRGNFFKEQAPQESAQNFFQAGCVLREYLYSPIKTYENFSKAFYLFPENEKYFLHTENICQESGLWKELIQIYQEKIKILHTHTEKVQLYLKAAAIAEKYLQKNAQALFFYQKAHQEAPKNVKIIKSLISIFEKRNQWREAAEAWQELLQLSDSVEIKDHICFQIANLYEKLGEEDLAISYYRAVVGTEYQEKIFLRLERIYSQKPAELTTFLSKRLESIYDDRVKFSLYNKLAQVQKDEKKSLEFYKLALTIYPQNEFVLQEMSKIAWNQKMFSVWYEYKFKKLELLKFQGLKVKELLHMGDALSVQGEFLLAAQCYEKILEIFPEHKFAIEKLVQIYEEKNEEKLQSILIHKSKHCSFEEKSAVYFQIAKLLSKRQKHKEAQSYYQKVLELREDQKDAIEKLKEYYIKEENEQELIKIFEKKIEIDPSHAANYYVEIAKIYSSMEELDKAIQFYQKAIEEEPRCWMAYKLLLPLLYQEKKWELYLQMAKQGLLLVKDIQETISLHGKIVEIYLQKQDIEKAKEHLAMVLRYDPANIPSLEKLSEIYKEEKNWAKHVNILEKMASFSEESDDLLKSYLEIADVYIEKIHDIEKAARYYEKAHYISPFSQEIITKLRKIAEDREDEEKLCYCLRAQAGISEDPKEEFSTWIELAEIYERRQEIENAIFAYRHALSIDPTNLKILDILIELNRQERNDKELIELLEEKVGLVTENLCEVYSEIVHIFYKKLHQPEKAIFYLEKMLEEGFYNTEIENNLIDLYSLGERWTDLLKLYQKKLDKAPQEEKLFTLRQMEDIYRVKLKDLYGLEQIYRQILEIIPEDQEVISKRQEICRKIEDWPSLIKAYEQELKITEEEERKAEIYQEIGKIYQDHCPNINLAIENYTKALNSEGVDYEILNNLHRLYLAQKDYKKAIETIEEEIKLLADPELEAHLFVEKGILYQKHLFDTESAIQAFQSALELCPTLMEAIEALENIFRKNKNYNELLQLLEEKQTLIPDEEAVELWIDIAKIYTQQLKEDDKAEAYFIRVLGKRPLHTEAHKYLKNIYYKYQNWKKLQVLYEQCISYFKMPQQKANMLFSLGKLYEEKLKDESQAASVYLKVLNTDSSNLPAIKSLQRIYEKGKRLDALAEAYMAELAVPDISPKRRITLLLRCGEIFDKELNRKDWAINYYERALELSPKSLIAVRALQELYTRKNIYDKLVNMLLAELGIEKNEKRLLTVHLELAKLYLEQMKDSKEAVFQMEKAQRYDPSDVKIYNSIKKILKENGHWKEYISHLQKGERFSSSPKEQQKIYLEISQVLQQELEAPEEAICYLEKALNVGSLPIIELHRLQNLYQKIDLRGNVAKLIKIYEIEKGITTDTQRLVALCRQSGILYERELNLPEKAVHSWEEALQLNPNDREVCSSLTQLYLKLNQWKKLACLYCHMVNIIKENSEKEDLFSKTGNIYEKRLNDSEKAVGYYQMVLSLNPKNMKALQGIRRIFEKQNNWHGVLDLLYKEAESYTGTEQASTYLKIAKIWELRLKLVNQAVDAYLKVLRLHFHQKTAKHTLTLLKSIREYDSFCKLITKIIHKTKDTVQKARLFCELGDILLQELDSPEEAIQAYQKALKYTPRKMDAISGLEEVSKNKNIGKSLPK